MGYKIRLSSRKDLDIILKWAENEGWNPGLYDAESFYLSDPQGFFLGFLDNLPISSISAVWYNDKFAFLGFYIVHPKFRSQGYDLKIWQEVLKRLPTQNIGLDGVVAQQKNYQKSGFKTAYRNIRYQGFGIKEEKSHPHLVLVKNIPFSKLKNYDDQIFPASRATFLKSWIQQPESLAVAYQKDGQILGYGVVRKCIKGFKIGPLYGDTEKIANILLQKSASFIGEKETLYLDVPEINRQAVKLAKKYNMKPVFETIRMYTKESPQIPIKKIFGITSFELG